MTPTGRVTPLDGLRGYAALCVVLNHSLIVYPWLRAVHSSGAPVDRDGVGWFVLTHTPVHLFWLGSEAVVTFFVLSGLALASQASRAGFSWRGYYPARLARLYLPVWAAMLWAVVVFLVVSRHGGAPWIGAAQARLESPTIVSDLLLTSGGDTFNGPLWSLRWELAFSLLLPLYLFLVRLRGVAMALKVATIFASVAVAAILLPDTLIGEALFYLPMFALGCLLAAHWDRVVALAARVDALPHGRAVWAAWLAASLLGLTAYWVVRGVETGHATVQLMQLVTLASAVSLVVNAGVNPRLRPLLEHRWSQWLGTISFSLYLVHAPVLSALESVLPTAGRPLVLMAGLPLALLVAWVFHRLVERPSHRLAKRIDRRLGRSNAPGAHTSGGAATVLAR